MREEEVQADAYNEAATVVTAGGTRKRTSDAVRQSMGARGLGIGATARLARVSPIQLAAMLRCETSWDVETIHRIATAVSADVWDLLRGQAPADLIQ